MKVVIAFWLAFTFSNLTAQKSSFRSNSTYLYKETREKELISRNVTISKDGIKITKLWNGGTEDAQFKIEKIEQRIYSNQPFPSTWYYCVDENESISMEQSNRMIHRKAIVIVPKNNNEYNPLPQIQVFEFVDEVTVYHYTLNIDLL